MIEYDIQYSTLKTFYLITYILTYYKKLLLKTYNLVLKTTTPIVNNQLIDTTSV